MRTVDIKQSLSILAPHLDFNGSSHTGYGHAAILTLYSTHGHLYVNGKIKCDELILKTTKDIVMFPEADIECRRFTSNSQRCFLEGKIYNSQGDKRLEIDINSDILHIRKDGVIGFKNKYNTSVICGSIQASLRNFGKIIAQSDIQLCIKEIPSLKNNQDDTSQRVYYAIQDQQTTFLSPPNTPKANRSSSK